MNFGSDYSGGSRNSSNRRENSGPAAKRGISNSKPTTYGKAVVPRTQDRSNSGSKGRVPYVPIHLRGPTKISPVRANAINVRTSPNQRGPTVVKPRENSYNKQSPSIPLHGNRFGVDFKGNRNLGGNSGSRDRVPKINSNY